MMTTDSLNLTNPTFKETVLIVDDDPHIREVIRFAMNKAGYQTCEAADGRQCLEVFSQCRPDIIILDILMPEMDGNEVCARIREKFEVPIIFLSSMDDEVDRIMGLESGGDDYVTKPFSPRELVARVKVILKRSSPSLKEKEREKVEDTAELFRHGCLTMDPVRFLVFWNEQEVVLTATEFALVLAMIRFPGRVYSRDELLTRVYDDVIVNDRTIDSHIRKIRKKFRKLGGKPVETVRSIGYKLGPCQIL